MRFLTLGKREFLFHDTEPSKIVQHARHAVSIDEDRKDFVPTMWKEKPGLDLKQVWFAGVHSDVGGGYDERGLGDCAVKWMMNEASACGLNFEAHLGHDVKPDPMDRQHNERKGIYMARRKFVRKIDGILHRSVKERWDADAHDYCHKSQALSRLLERSGGWGNIELVD